MFDAMAAIPSQKNRRCRRGAKADADTFGAAGAGAAVVSSSWILMAWPLPRDEHLPTGRFYPKVLFDVDGDEVPEHLHRALLSFHERVVLLRRQVHDAPHVQRACLRSADGVFDVKQGLVVAGLKGRAVVAQEIRPAEGKDPVFPGTQVHLFQNLSGDTLGVPGTLL